MASPFDDIFGGSGPQWTREQIISRIRGEADRQKVDPDLAVAVATQESSLDPDNHGDKGRSRGVFHLQERAAIDAGIDPRWRDDPGVNIYGGVRYLKQKLDQSKGNVEQALSRYNRGTPDYRGIGDPDYVYHVLRHYPDHPLGKAPANPEGYAARLKKTFGVSLGPRSAEAATPQQAASPWDDIFGAQTPTQAPAPPTATSTPEQDAAYRSSRGQQAPATAPQTAPAPTTQPEASQAPPAPPPDPSATPGMRFQALPSITQLEPADRIQKTRDFERLKPALQEEFLRSEEPTAGGLALQRFLALPSIASLDPPEREAAIADFQAMQPTQQEEVIKMERPGYWQQTKRLGVPDEAPVTESLTAPSTMIPLLMPGAALKFVPGALKTGAPLAYRGARAAAEGLSQTAGWTTGRTIETGEVPSPGEIGTEAAFNVAAGGILEGLGAAGQAILSRSQAGKAIVAADEATTAARQAWAQEVTTAKTELQAGRTEAYQAAERRAKAAQAQYQAKVKARDATIAANQQEYDQAVTAHRATVQGEQAARYGEARTGAMDESAAARASQQQYQQAVTGQQQAITTARATPGQYTPETPSWVMYEKFGDAAKDAVVDLAPAKAALADVRASRGVLSDGSIRPFPSAVESIASNLEKATGETSFKTIREELRRLGPLTKSQDGNVRGAAKQLYGIYADVLEASPIANDLLKNANATFRKEMAVQDIADWLKPGHGIVRIDNMGRETINVGALMTRLEKTVADDSLFRRSFTPDELDALRKDIRGLAGTPTMPGGQVPPGARPELLPGAAPNVPASMAQTPTPKDLPNEIARPRQELLPGAAPGRRGTAEQRALVAPGAEPPAAVTPREALGERPKVFKDLTKTAMQEYMGSLFGVKPLLITSGKLLWRGGQQLRYGLARGLLSDRGRPALLRAMADSPTISPRLHGVMINGLSDAERKALLRDTRETREKRR